MDTKIESNKTLLDLATQCSKELADSIDRIEKIYRTQKNEISHSLTALGNLQKLKEFEETRHQAYRGLIELIDDYQKKILGLNTVIADLFNQINTVEPENILTVMRLLDPAQIHNRDNYNINYFSQLQSNANIQSRNSFTKVLIAKDNLRTNNYSYFLKLTTLKAPSGNTDKDKLINLNQSLNTLLDEVETLYQAAYERITSNSNITYYEQAYQLSVLSEERNKALLSLDDQYDSHFGKLAVNVVRIIQEFHKKMLVLKSPNTTLNIDHPEQSSTTSESSNNSAFNSNEFYFRASRHCFTYEASLSAIEDKFARYEVAVKNLKPEQKQLKEITEFMKQYPPFEHFWEAMNTVLQDYNLHLSKINQDSSNEKDLRRQSLKTAAQKVTSEIFAQFGGRTKILADLASAVPELSESPTLNELIAYEAMRTKIKELLPLIEENDTNKSTDTKKKSKQVIDPAAQSLGKLRGFAAIDKQAELNAELKKLFAVLFGPTKLYVDMENLDAKRNSFVYDSAGQHLYYISATGEQTEITPISQKTQACITTQVTDAAPNGIALNTDEIDTILNDCNPEIRSSILVPANSIVGRYIVNTDSASDDFCAWFNQEMEEIKTDYLDTFIPALQSYQSEPSNKDHYESMQSLVFKGLQRSGSFAPNGELFLEKMLTMIHEYDVLEYKTNQARGIGRDQRLRELKIERQKAASFILTQFGGEGAVLSDLVIKINNLPRSQSLPNLFSREIMRRKITEIVKLVNTEPAYADALQTTNDKLNTLRRFANLSEPETVSGSWTRFGESTLLVEQLHEEYQALQRAGHVDDSEAMNQFKKTVKRCLGASHFGEIPHNNQQHVNSLSDFVNQNERAQLNTQLGQLFTRLFGSTKLYFNTDNPTQKKNSFAYNPDTKQIYYVSKKGVLSELTALSEADKRLVADKYEQRTDDELFTTLNLAEVNKLRQNCTDQQKADIVTPTDGFIKEYLDAQNTWFNYFWDWVAPATKRRETEYLEEFRDVLASYQENPEDPARYTTMQQKVLEGMQNLVSIVGEGKKAKTQSNVRDSKLFLDKIGLFKHELSGLNNPAPESAASVQISDLVQNLSKLKIEINNSSFFYRMFFGIHPSEAAILNYIDAVQNAAVNYETKLDEEASFTALNDAINNKPVAPNDFYLAKVFGTIDSVDNTVNTFQTNITNTNTSIRNSRT